MTFPSPTDSITRRPPAFNAYSSASSIPIRATWKLHTQKLINGAWVTIASFPTVRQEHRHDQRERLKRHARAFGGSVRLLNGEVLLVEWCEGILVEDWREVAA